MNSEEPGQHQESEGAVSELPLILYDGDCGLCHGFVKYVLARDSEGVFLFSPLQGEAIKGLMDESQRKELPDSVVVVTPEQEVLCRSDAVGYVLSRLSGSARMQAKLLRLFPRFLRDTGYNGIASIRKKIFKKPDDVCPLVPQELRKRFLA